VLTLFIDTRVGFEFGRADLCKFGSDRLPEAVARDREVGVLKPVVENLIRTDRQPHGVVDVQRLAVSVELGVTHNLHNALATHGIARKRKGHVDYSPGRARQHRVVREANPVDAVGRIDSEFIELLVVTSKRREYRA